MRDNDKRPESSPDSSDSDSFNSEDAHSSEEHDAQHFRIHLNDYYSRSYRTRGWVWSNLRRVRKYPDDLFVMSWWCALRLLPNYLEWAAYLQLNAWIIPNGLDDCGVVQPLTPVMYGHLTLTQLAIDLLFKDNFKK